MQGTLDAFLTGGVLAFLLTFVRLGSAIMIMPGLGDSFISGRVRLHLALAISFTLFPFVMSYMPSPIPALPGLVFLIGTELVTGVLIGTVARIFMTSLDTAGMIISMQSGLSNAQVFNPALSVQGSLIGAFLSVSGLLLLFATNMHHLLLMGLVESYAFFPMGGAPDTGSMADMITRAVSQSFAVGFSLSFPFIVVTLLIYVGMGVLSRLMPQIQVFMLAVPVQIWLSLFTLSMVLTTLFFFWLKTFEEGIDFFLRSAGG
jgi:flagellar biosynthetic protein FliR